MINKIKQALSACGISAWRINEQKIESAELFFVQKQLDTRRIKDVCQYDVEVYCDAVGADGQKTRGANSVRFAANASTEELERKLRGAYYAAQFAANPYYDLPDPVTADTIYASGDLAETPLSDSAWAMAQALFATDSAADAFVNSAEIFAAREYCRILSSVGTDVSFTDASVEGEFVVQCVDGEDVELHQTFRFDSLAREALAEKVQEALAFVRDRAHASRTLQSGKYDVVLSAENVDEILQYYAARSDASLLYPQYSKWKVGDAVQHGENGGESLCFSLDASRPYDASGTPLHKLELMRDGELLAVHGENRFCRYLFVKPTGVYTKLCCSNGQTPLAQLKGGKCLWVVAFSDFQMDEMSGHFGGEIRLAYLIDGDKATPVTGGSVNGSLIKLQNSMRFSSERYTTATYDGPYAVRIPDVSVAGC